MWPRHPEFRPLRLSIPFPFSVKGSPATPASSPTKALQATEQVWRAAIRQISERSGLKAGQNGSEETA
jgi:head-tail adaptor